MVELVRGGRKQKESRSRDKITAYVDHDPKRYYGECCPGCSHCGESVKFRTGPICVPDFSKVLFSICLADISSCILRNEYGNRTIIQLDELLRGKHCICSLW